MNRHVCICAGGTGGHINAAISLGAHFSEREFDVVFYSGTRYLDYQLFKKTKHTVIHLDSKPLRASNPFVLAKNCVMNLFVFMTVFFKYLSNRPLAVIGAGGYVCGPPLLAAKLLGIKIYIIEQNAVAGLTNKILSKISDKVFLNFKETKGLEGSEKTVVAGNPIRAEISYRKSEIGDPLRILVFGGSLGARQINEAVKVLVARNWNRPVSIVHQVGKGNLEKYKAGSNVIYDQKEYLDNMDELYRWANIVVSRAGASTISELRIAKRPAILIPAPFVTDNHQKHNAEQLAKEGLFHVKVLESTLSSKDAGKEIFEAVEEILEKNYLHPFKESAIPNSCEIIFKEVMDDVRN